MQNRHGLSRYIPDDIKRAVRQASGFGCVVCGASIVEYEHVDPPFNEAFTHDPLCIALLCHQCHGQVTRGFWSKQKIKDAMLSPKSKQSGFSSDFFDLGKTHPEIIFGGVTLRNCKIPIQVKDLPLFQIQAGELPGAPFRLSGHFFDAAGNHSLSVIDNQWIAMASNWDIEFVGGTIVIRDLPNHISLKLRASPPNGIVVEQLDMIVYGYHFIAGPDLLEFGLIGKGKNKFSSCLMDNCNVGMMLG